MIVMGSPIDRAASVTAGTKMPRSTFPFGNIDVHFLGLYGPQRCYLPIVHQDTPRTIWFWVHGARARARTREGAHKKKQ